MLINRSPTQQLCSKVVVDGPPTFARRSPAELGHQTPAGRRRQVLRVRYLSEMAESQPSPAQAIDFLTLLHNLKVNLCSFYENNTLDLALDMDCL